MHQFIIDIIRSMTAFRTNDDWLHDLATGSDSQAAAITDLRDLLLRASLYYFSRNLDDFLNLSRDEILQRAEDCAQDALIAVMSHLADFKGDSQFTTWTYKFAINKSLMAARRERWKSVSFEQLEEPGGEAFINWAGHAQNAGPLPEQSAMQDELTELIREVIEHDLTEKQRQVLVLMVFKEVPMDEAARYLDTNRNALYKLLHDARKKIKARLQEKGFQAVESIAIFETRE